MFSTIGIFVEIFAPPKIARTGFSPDFMTLSMDKTSFSSSFPKNLCSKN